MSCGFSNLGAAPTAQPALKSNSSAATVLHGYGTKPLSYPLVVSSAYNDYVRVRATMSRQMRCERLRQLREQDKIRSSLLLRRHRTRAHALEAEVREETRHDWERQQDVQVAELQEQLRQRKSGVGSAHRDAALLGGRLADGADRALHALAESSSAADKRFHEAHRVILQEKENIETENEHRRESVCRAKLQAQHYRHALRSAMEERIRNQPNDFPFPDLETLVKKHAQHVQVRVEKVTSCFVLMFSRASVPKLIE